MIDFCVKKSISSMLKTLSFLIYICFLFALGQSVCAVNPTGAPKKVYLIHWQKEGRTVLGDTFVNYLKSKDYNIEYIERFAEQDKTNIPKYIAEIRKIKPDLIYVYSTTGILELAGAYDAVDPAKHITDIPIIAAAHSAPVGSKVVKEVSVPTGRNVTGVGHYIPTKTLIKIMQEYTYPLKKIVSLRSEEANSRATTESVERVAKEQGLVAKTFVHRMEQQKIAPGAIDEVVVSILNEKPDFIYLPSDGANQGSIKEIVASFIRHKDIHAAPLFTTLEDMVRPEKSCTFALFTSFTVMGLMAGVQAEEILYGGKKVSEMPYQLGSQMTLAIREDTMNALKTYPLLSLIETAEILK